MKKTLLFTSILMIAGAMNAWADCESNYPYDCVHGALSIKDTTINNTACYKAFLDDSVAVEDAYITIDKDIDNVCFFEYNREFSSGYNVPSTLILPFDMQSGECLSSFAGVHKLDTLDLVRSSIKATRVSGKFEAHTPYFLQVNDKATGLQIGNYCFPLTLKKTDKNAYISNINKWEFTGTYSYKKWEEGNPDIGFFYGFAAKSKEVVQTDGKTKSVSQGQFVKGKAGAFIKPARAYLIYNQNSTAAANRPSMYGVKSVSSIKAEDLPETIDVIFQDENGETTSIAQMNTVTGEFTSVTGWYDMKGRKLNKKPTQKGTYFNNGKKVVIK